MKLIRKYKFFIKSDIFVIYFFIKRNYYFLILVMCFFYVKRNIFFVLEIKWRFKIIVLYGGLYGVVISV